MSDLGITCPYGGSFFICEHNTTEFIGCCTIDPCAGGAGRCPQKNLRPTSFARSRFDDILPLDCDSEKGSSIWYTCNFTSPPFLGCCKSDPCNALCPQVDLVPAVLSTDTAAREVFFPPVSTVSAVPVPVRGLSIGAITGIALGGLASIGIFAVLMYIWGRHNGKKGVQAELEEYNNEDNSNMPSNNPASNIKNASTNMPAEPLPGHQNHIEAPEDLKAVRRFSRGPIQHSEETYGTKWVYDNLVTPYTTNLYSFELEARPRVDPEELHIF